MRKYACATMLTVALFLLAASPLAAVGQERHSLRDGAWALQFSVNDDFQLGSFQGSTISAKHHYSDRTALRYGLTLSTDFSSNDPGDTAELEEDVQRLGVGLTTYYLVHPDLLEQPDASVHLFWGLGPAISYDRERRESGAGDLSVTQKSTTWRAGVGGVVGAEWFVRPRISLMAEYGSFLGYRRTSRETENELQTIEGPNSSGFGLAAEGVRFGVSVYVRAD